METTTDDALDILFEARVGMIRDMYEYLQALGRGDVAAPGCFARFEAYALLRGASKHLRRAGTSPEYPSQGSGDSRRLSNGLGSVFLTSPDTPVPPRAS